MDPPPYSQPQQPVYPPQGTTYQGNYLQQQPAAVTVTVPAQQVTSQVVVVGNCPVCHVGNTREEYTACGIILAVVFFPLGVICCLMMTERVCSHCGARTGP
ncbi:brain protein I3-like [Acanthaster planci]|uniref:Membrane protein BRI3 n=1 Tax=Acanthaster planci TaxID=133434 RepID=A0A8B7XYV9_ACAPL|nr:brain protein I3-like [Acanthaster planci]